MLSHTSSAGKRLGTRVALSVPATLSIRDAVVKGLIRNVAARGVGFQKSDPKVKLEGARGTLWGVGGPVEVRVCWIRDDSVGLEFLPV